MKNKKFKSTVLDLIEDIECIVSDLADAVETTGFMIENNENKLDELDNDFDLNLSDMQSDFNSLLEKNEQLSNKIDNITKNQDLMVKYVNEMSTQINKLLKSENEQLIEPEKTIAEKTYSVDLLNIIKDSDKINFSTSSKESAELIQYLYILFKYILVNKALHFNVIKYIDKEEHEKSQAKIKNMVVTDDQIKIYSKLFKLNAERQHEPTIDAELQNCKYNLLEVIKKLSERE